MRKVLLFLSHELFYVLPMAQVVILFSMEEVRRRKLFSEKPILLSRCLLHRVGGGHSRCDRERKIKEDFSPGKVFIDIPYQSDYQFESLIWSIVDEYQLEPILAKDEGERTDEQRICRICRLIQSSKYGVVDLFTEGTYNIPFEYGLMVALGKPCAVLVEDRFDIDKVFSDIKGVDQPAHHKSEKELARRLSEWIFSNVNEIPKDISEVIPYQSLLDKSKIVKAAVGIGIGYRVVRMLIKSRKIDYKKGIHFSLDISNDGNVTVKEH